MEFAASAPCKAILFGEHYVVYGSPALSIAIEPRNTVKFFRWEGDGVALHSDYGIGRISRDGRYDGPRDLEVYQAVANSIFPGARIPSCRAEFIASWKLKGVGSSASFCAAFAAGLCRLAGKKLRKEEIFAAAQAGDLVAHGGRASGIDAKTVSFGCPLIFRRSFSPPAFESATADFSLSRKAALLLVDTFVGKKEGTGRMLEIFAQEFGITTSPDEAPEEKRRQIRDEYSPLWEKIRKVIGKASAKQVGELMNENHALLKKRKMSSEGIERAVSAALSAGACGAKLTGGGGEGGAVLALCERKCAEKMMQKISDETGFGCHLLSLAKKGACVE